MTYIYEPGDVIRSSEHNKNINDLYKVQGEKAINDVSATNSGVLAGSSQVLIDKFLDSNGHNNTVDTANSTWLYHDDGYYICMPNSSTGSDLTQNSGAVSSTQTVNYYSGHRITANKNVFIKSVTKHASCTATDAKLYTLAGAVIATANFSGNTATFSPEILLTKGTTYRVEAGNNGSNYTSVYRYPASYPYNNTEVNFIGASVGGSGGSNVRIDNIVSIIVKLPSTSDYIDSVGQSTVVTIPTGMTKVFVTPLMYEALATGDSITADVSIDNGAHYTTGIPINTWTPITSANGTQLIVKANLRTNDGTTTPKVLGWRVLME